ncbi:MAG TPA: thioredoxin domain-containing protein [bacterium]|jgi:thioredoxin
MSIFKSLFNGGEVKPGKPMETSDATFDQDILKSELPVLLDFWSPTCMPCQVMGGLLRDLGPEYVGRVNIFKLNVSQNMQTASAFRIRSIPTLMFIKDGKIVDQVVGLIPIETLRQKLDKLAPLPVVKDS